MKDYNFKKIDAFATEKSGGNPAGFILLKNWDDTTEKEMQQIAYELRGFANEVGYVVQTEDKSFELRYFSQIREVDFCGHATIAIFYDLLKSNNQLQLFDKLTIKTNRGVSYVENRIKKDNAVFIMAPKPIFKEESISKTMTAKALGISEDSILQEKPLSVVNGGLETLVVPLKSLETILNVSPNFKTLKKFCSDINIDVMILFSEDVNDPTSDYRTRVFCPTFGYLEDPATGSGNAAFGYYFNPE